MLRSSLAERLKELRTDTGRSADEVADAVGIKRSTLATIENGHDNPGRETLVALANYYRVSLDWLGRHHSAIGLLLDTPTNSIDGRLLGMPTSSPHQQPGTTARHGER